MNLPNRITLARVLLSPILAVLMLIDEPVMQTAAIALFVLASLSDMLDGRIARRMNLITDFGKLMDPIADKLLIMVTMVALCAQSRIHPAFVMITLAREFVISGVRIVAASKGTVIAADMSGKLKTLAQMIALPIIIATTGAHYEVFDLLFWPGQILLYLSIALSIWSMAAYIFKNREVLAS